MTGIKSWGQRLIEFAISVFAAAVLLSWAWQLLRPVAPAILTGAGLFIITAGFIRWRRGW
ncbi:MAG: hypothetical protein LC808_00125 [Actinobacteria bacterium]|nr:hypothetical protein [Actinomycetota bacterium]